MLTTKSLFFTMVLGTTLLAPACALSVHSPARMPTLHEQTSTADVVLVVRAENARKDGKKATTDLVILELLKGAAHVEGKKKIQVPRFIERNPKEAVLLVFGEVFKGNLDMYRGLDAAPELVDYVKRGMAYSPKERPMLLRHCVEHLGSQTDEIMWDVLRELNKTGDAELAAIAKKLAPDRLRAILRTDQAKPWVLAKAMFLLAHCGDASDKKLMNETIIRLKVKEGYGFEEALKSLILLDAKDGEKVLFNSLSCLKAGEGIKDEKFGEWYLSLKVARYFHDERRDIVGKKEIEHALEPNLQIAGVADFIIEDFRRWKRWDKAKVIIALARKDTHQVRVVQHAILRYALECPQEVARDYVAEQRRLDPDRVSDVEETLKVNP